MNKNDTITLTIQADALELRRQRLLTQLVLHSSVLRRFLLMLDLWRATSRNSREEA